MRMELEGEGGWFEGTEKYGIRKCNDGNYGNFPLHK